MKKYEGIRLPEKTDLHLLGDLIYVLDSYCIQRYEDLSLLNKSIEKLKFGRTFRDRWKKEISPLLYRMASLPMTLPRVKLLVKFRKIFGFIAAIFFTVSFITLIARAPEYMLILSASTIILVAWYVVRSLIDYAIGKTLNHYYEEHPEKFGLIRSRLKPIVQSLLDEFSRLSINLSEKTVPLIDLYNIDYEGIRVIKKPFLLRKYFVVAPKNVRQTKPSWLGRLRHLRG